MLFPYWTLPVREGGVGRGGVKGLAQMVWSTLFPHPNGEFLVLGGPERLPGWFVNFLLIVHCQKTDKKG